MINNSMYIFSAFVVLAVIVLMGNLTRLGMCTVRMWKETTAPLDRFKSVSLFLIYATITGVFVWCACASLCDIYCPLVV